ncbi:tetratricopeptide repeat protein [Micromonospora sp. NPDC049359]|uniref:tetratricopeptide repeat protein n=1 Tax=Micromonospora sp. NPDC049359 TaxID=3364270 RepID=UPI0037B97A18
MTARVAGYDFLGWVAADGASPAGTCFQVEGGVLVTAHHVLVDIGAAAVGSMVRVGPVGVGAGWDATVERFDEVHDLAVLRAERPLPGSASHLVVSDGVRDNEAVTTAGYPTVEDDGHEYELLTAGGHWRGPALRDGVLWSRLQADAVMPGMSGAPVLRASDRAVIGVVSGRYNSQDGWLAGAVWVSRVEDLSALLEGVASVVVEETTPANGLLDLVLTVSQSEVRLSGCGQDVTAEHRGVSAGLANALHDVRRERARLRAVVRDLATGGQAAGVVSLRRAGELMAESFLPVAVAQALARVIRRAQREHVPVRVGVQAPDWWWLPWEALPEPVTGRPVVLHELVSVYRRVDAAGSRSAAAPGPLRIVVAIASPEAGSGPLLDYERELGSVLDAVHGAHRSRAVVRIVPFATTAAIRAVLAEDTTHVLHLSAHGAPGVLHLEDEQGRPRSVDPETLIAEAIPEGRMPRVISLAACYTDVDGEDGAGSFAARLARRGAGAVIATQTSVTDVYATRLFAAVYAELAASARPDVVAAVAQARRRVQRDLATGPDPLTQAVGGMDEWSVVSVLAATPSVAVADGTAPAESRAEIVPDLGGLLARPVGQFVGRRPAQRVLPGLLSDGTGTAVLLHGIGGVGKTTLAAEVVRRLLDTSPDWRLVTVTGPVTVDGLLTALADAARRELVLRTQFSGPPMVAVQTAGRVDLPWSDRFALLRDQVLAGVRILVVLDNFEDNLIRDGGIDGGWSVGDSGLAGLLAAWLTSPGRSRLLITSRYRFGLPVPAAERLHPYQVPPLSLAETRKLLWSLPRLDRHAADIDAVQRIWQTVGGHPRALEYLDALLPGNGGDPAGRGRFADITRRLHHAVETRLGTAGTAAWLAQQRTLDAALADTVTLAADDVLLTEHLTRLGAIEGAVRLLAGISVYREPVDVNGLLFQVGVAKPDAEQQPGDMAEAAAEITDLLSRYALDLNGLAEAIGQDSPLTPVDTERLVRLLEQARRPPQPPFTAPPGMAGLAQKLATTSLIAIVDDGRIVMHRWTAAELHRHWNSDQGPHHRPGLVTAAHRAAATYWQWRVGRWPQDRLDDLHDLGESRHHLLAAGDLETAGTITEHICSQLDEWGAWDREASLIHDTLRWLPENSPRRPAWYQQLGILAQLRGDYAEAERRYQQSLAIEEALGNQAGMASSYHQMGILAQYRGDYAEAERRYQQSLAIEEELGNQSGVAASYGQLGTLAQLRGDYGEAERRYQQSLAISEGLGNRSGMAANYHQLGILAQGRGDYGEAERRYQQSLAIKEELGNRSGMATGYHQLGILAQYRGDYAEAERRYQQSLTIEEELGNQAGMAASYGQLGTLAQLRGDYEEAERRHQQSLAINEGLGNQSGMAINYHHLGILAQERGDYGEAEHRYQQSLAIKEELGNQSGMAASYHQMGVLAQLRGDYREAERRYQQSRAINEGLSNQADMATSISQLGTLRTEMGEFGEAVTFHCQALAIRLGIGVPQAGFNFARLRELRRMLGEHDFRGAVIAALDEQSVRTLIALLDQAEGPEQEDGTGRSVVGEE